MTRYSYVVTLLTGGPTVITNDIEEVETVETGTGEVKSAKIRLNSMRGKYITVAPIIAEFNQIKIKITDDDSVDEEQIYEVNKIIPVKNAGEGYVLELELLGQEYHLMNKDIAKQFYFESATFTTKNIVDFYNDDLGTLQPTVQNHDTFTTGNNELPEWTSNTFEFGVAEIAAYDALIEVVEGLGTSIAAGGAGDFFELYFNSNIADPTKIDFEAFVSGSKPSAGSEVTITDSTSVNESPTEGGIDAITGTVVKAWGKKDVGTLPLSVQDFQGQLEAFRLNPVWKSGVTYPIGVRVQNGGDLTHYESNVSTTNEPPHADWDNIQFDDVFGASSKYSEWTEGRVDEWKSSGTDPSTVNDGLGCWDSNLIIEDGTYFQTWVTKRVNSNAVGVGAGEIPAQFLYSSTEYYRGLRFLVDPNIGTIVGFFAQNSGLDRFGREYSNNVVAQNGGTADSYLDWDVIHVTSDLERCAIRDEGRVYERQSGTWTNIATTGRANHCFHLPSTITNESGYNSTSDGSGTYGDGSAVEWLWIYEAFASIDLFGLYTTPGYYKIGAWANLSFPFPENSYFSNTIGELFGNNVTKKEPVTLDVNNMHLTPSGFTGFNNVEAETLGPLNGIQFQMKFKWLDVIGARVVDGDFKMRCTMYDSNDNVVIQDFVIPFNDIWQQIKLPFKGFQPYRARIPLDLGNIAPNLFTKDLEILNVFQWKNIKMICWQWQEVYDKEGRFDPVVGSKAIGIPTPGLTKIFLAIDAFAFTKPLLAVTTPVTDRVIEPKALQFPDVSNSVQLGQIANSQLEIEKFPLRKFTITTLLKNDIKFGDTFFLTDARLVNDADTRTADSGGTANTIRLVAKKIIRKITKRSATGAGSAMRTIIGVKRII